MIDPKHSAAVKAGQVRARERNAKIDDLTVLLKTFGVNIVAGYYTKKRYHDRDADFRFRLYHMDRPGKIEYYRDLEELTGAVNRHCTEATNG